VKKKGFFVAVEVVVEHNIAFKFGVIASKLCYKQQVETPLFNKGGDAMQIKVAGAMIDLMKNGGGAFTMTSTVVLVHLLLGLGIKPCQGQKGEVISCSSAAGNGGLSLGCLAESLIPINQTYLVEFQDTTTSQYAHICLQTCENIYTNTR
jgi:hypothetical protein